MSKQRKFILISSAVGFISMFLPWVSISMFGFSQHVNGMHDKGIIVFICFVAAGIIAYMGNPAENLEITMWAATLLTGTIALLFIMWFYSQATNSIMGLSVVGYGVYIAALAAIGILASAYVFRSPTDNIKNGFDSLKRGRKEKTGSDSKQLNTVSTTPPDFSDNNIVEKYNTNTSR